MPPPRAPGAHGRIGQKKKTGELSNRYVCEGGVVTFEKVTLGYHVDIDTKPWFHLESVEGDSSSLTLQLKLDYQPDVVDINIGVFGLFSILVKHLKFQGTLSVKLSNLMEEVPVVGYMQTYFEEAPTVEVTLGSDSRMSRFMPLGRLTNYIVSAVQSQLQSMVVLPNVIGVPVGYESQGVTAISASTPAVYCLIKITQTKISSSLLGDMKNNPEAYLDDKKPTPICIVNFEGQDTTADFSIERGDCSFNHFWLAVFGNGEPVSVKFSMPSKPQLAATATGQVSQLSGASELATETNPQVKISVIRQQVFMPPTPQKCVPTSKVCLLRMKILSVFMTAKLSVKPDVVYKGAKDWYAYIGIRLNVTDNKKESLVSKTMGQHYALIDPTDKPPLSMEDEDCRSPFSLNIPCQKIHTISNINYVLQVPIEMDKMHAITLEACGQSWTPILPASELSASDLLSRASLRNAALPSADKKSGLTRMQGSDEDESLWHQAQYDLLHVQ